MLGVGVVTAGLSALAPWYPTAFAKSCRLYSLVAYVNNALKDCINGSGMKGTKFEQLMGDSYKMLCEAQLREEQMAYELLVCTNRNSLGDPNMNSIPGHNPPVPFFPRHGKDLLRHFKVDIFPAVSRYCVICATTPIGKGQNETV
jgi:hypothetical protein